MGTLILVIFMSVATFALWQFVMWGIWKLFPKVGGPMATAFTKGNSRGWAPGIGPRYVSREEREKDIQWYIDCHKEVCDNIWERLSVHPCYEIWQNMTDETEKRRYRQECIRYYNLISGREECEMFGLTSFMPEKYGAKSVWVEMEAMKMCEEAGCCCGFRNSSFPLPPMDIFKYGEPFSEEAWEKIKPKYRPRED